MITHPAALLLLAACALALLSCSRPEPRPPPDLGQTMKQLAQIREWAETRQEQACAVPMKVDFRAECYYPNRIAAMEVVRE